MVSRASLALLQPRTIHPFRNRVKPEFRLSLWYHMGYAQVWKLQFHHQFPYDTCALILHFCSCDEGTHLFLRVYEN